MKKIIQNYNKQLSKRLLRIVNGTNTDEDIKSRQNMKRAYEQYQNRSISFAEYDERIQANPIIRKEQYVH